MATAKEKLLKAEAKAKKAAAKAKAEAEEEVLEEKAVLEEEVPRPMTLNELNILSRKQAAARAEAEKE